jgi:hypothetical protein
LEKQSGLGYLVALRGWCYPFVFRSFFQEFNAVSTQMDEELLAEKDLKAMKAVLEEDLD